MKNVLLVEDSKFFADIIGKRFAAKTEYRVLRAESMAEALELVEEENDWLAALVDLTLPDSSRGEVVDNLLKYNIPIIVYTGNYEEKTREAMLDKHVVDYVLKDNPSSLDDLVNAVARLEKNAATKVLVVDDSRSSRGMIRIMLQDLLFPVLEAESGEDALEVLQANPGIKLVITDFTMAGMDGGELVRTIRRKHPREDMAIIGVSASDKPTLSARFIKQGASDFLHKPFLAEELHCRVIQNLEMVERIALVRELADRDHLTGLRNRRSFFQEARQLFQQVGMEGGILLAAMADIDHFKLINDTHGHSAGDKVLQAVAGLLESHFGSECLVGRFGGEEFAVFTDKMAPDQFTERFEEFRRALEELVVQYQDQTVSCTISAGICLAMGPDVDSMLTSADDALYQAKGAGRNRIVAA